MSIDVRVPTTGNAGEDAVVLEWNVGVGAEVAAGELLVTLETAKATVEVEAPASGHVLRILFEEGAEAPEHEILAILGAPDEVLPGIPGVTSTDPSGTAGQSVRAQLNPAPSETAAGYAASPAAPHGTPGRIAASPKARRIASERGVELSTLTGTGPGGRIVIADVVAAPVRTFEPETEDSPSVPVHPTHNTVPGSAPAEFITAPVRGARKVTAQRMSESLQNTAQVTLTRYAGADALLSYSRRLREVTDSRGLPKIGLNDLVLFATARAVALHPAANSWFDWDGIRQFSHVNLGFAVDTGQALLVPVLPYADLLSLSDLSAAAATAIEKARSGRLSTPEMEGGTFTVSNLGGLGVHWFTPVLNSPQSCILGVGATHAPYPEGPALLPLSLTFDHRALDGAAAAALLAEIAVAIEAIDVLAAF